MDKDIARTKKVVEGDSATTLEVTALNRIGDALEGIAASLKKIAEVQALVSGHDWTKMKARRQKMRKDKDEAFLSRIAASGDLVRKRQMLESRMKKLPPDDRQEIRRRIMAGDLLDDIAKDFGLGELVDANEEADRRVRQK